MPKFGASAFWKKPSTLPSTSTTAMETRALLPSGCRMAARVRVVCCAAWSRMRATSAAVSTAPARVGKRGSACPATPPTVAATSVDGGVARGAGEELAGPRRGARRRHLHVDVGQADAVGQDAVGADLLRHLEAARSRERRLLLGRGVVGVVQRPRDRCRRRSGRPPPRRRRPRATPSL